MAAKVRTKFDRRKLERKFRDASFRNLGHAGAGIRKTASFSIRRRKRPSMPGQAPHTQTGHLKRAIRYDVNRRQLDVSIGPVNNYARTIWDLHEFGGMRANRRRALQQTRFRIGQSGPIRRVGPMQRDRRGRFVRRSKNVIYVKLRSAAQVQRAERFVARENEFRQREASKPKRYAPRPFMRPALAQNLSRIPKFWRNSLEL